jgi:AcrR family transcriptional regulator
VTRAAPLPLDERRAALITATEPLLELFGREVSTRQIAEAAGVAEGTIFRAFPTKEALIEAVIAEVFDNQRTCEELSRVDLDADLDSRLGTAVAILQERLRRVFVLFHSLRLTRPEPEDHESFRVRQEAANAQLNEVLAKLLEPDRHRLRVDPRDAASALRTVTFCMTHPMLGDPDLAQPAQIVDLVLHGLVKTPPAPQTERSSC